MYKCCLEDDGDGMCNSDDPDVECTDKYIYWLKHQICVRDSLQCGNEIVFVVDSAMTATTTDFFKRPTVCLYKVRTYE